MAFETNSTRQILSLQLQDWTKIPTGPQWSLQRKPARTHITIRVKTIRLSDGTTLKFFLQRERPVSLREVRALETEIDALTKEVNRTLTSAIVRSERRFIRQPRRRKKARR